MTWTPRKAVVVPVDFSEESLQAIDTALEFTEASNLHIVHVLPPLAPAEPAVVWNTVTEETAREHAEALLKAKLSPPRFQGCRTAVEFGSPAPEIAAYAEEVEADLIVIPSHGRTGISRLLIGSVAERVVRMAHCPVLVLRD